MITRIIEKSGFFSFVGGRRLNKPTQSQIIALNSKNKHVKKKYDELTKIHG